MSKKRYRTIESFIRMIIAGTLIPAFIIILASAIHLIRMTMADSRAKVLSRVELLADSHLHLVERMNSYLEVLKGTAVLSCGSPEHLKALYTTLLASAPELVNITLADDKGIVIASSKLAPGFSVADRKHIKDALANNGIVVGNYIKNYATGEDAIAFAESFTLPDTGARVVQAIIFRVSSYRDILDLDSLDEDSFCGITDASGTRLFTYPPMDIFPSGEQVSPALWELMQASRKPGSSVFNYADRVERLIAYKPLYLPGAKDPYLYIVYGKPYAHFLEPAYTQLLLEFLGIVLLLAATLVISSSLTKRYIARPIHEIVEHVNKIEYGDYATRSTVVNKETDLGRIAYALDEMSEAIEARNSNLEQNQRQLEKILVEKDVLLREVHHRIKNNLQVILSLMDLESDKKKTVAEFIDALRTRIASLVNVYEMVYVSGDVREIEFSEYIESLVAVICGDLYGFPESRIELSLGNIKLPVDKVLLLGLVVQELVVNSIKHGVNKAEGMIKIVLDVHNDNICSLVISDAGTGFRKSAEEMQKGVGLILVESLVSQLHANISWNYENGTTCSIEFACS